MARNIVPESLAFALECCLQEETVRLIPPERRGWIQSRSAAPVLVLERGCDHPGPGARRALTRRMIPAETSKTMTMMRMVSYREAIHPTPELAKRWLVAVFRTARTTRPAIFSFERKADAQSYAALVLAPGVHRAHAAVVGKPVRP